MRRRDVLRSTLAGAAALAAPNIVKAQAARVLRFLPQADLATLDPVWTTADVTRNHAHLVFDTLYGQDNSFQPQPQMAAGHVVSADKTQWDITLRPGLKFHDGTPVLARDCVASIQRWWQRDGFGGVLRAATDEVSAPSDTVIRFRLKKPFPLLADALAVTSNMCAIMPERLAQTDAMKQVTDMVGSGPYRFIAAERVTGSRVAYERFAGYVPRDSGPAEMTAGPKVAQFDRVEWTVVPDPATKAAAMRAGEFDWWENPTIDLLGTLKGMPALTTVVKDHSGATGIMRFNCLHPPFDSAAIRRIVVSAIDQHEFMEAVAGAAPELIRTGMGLFVPGTPLASTVGIDLMQGPKDPAKLKAELAAAGYKGERIVLLAASDYPVISALAMVGGDLLRRIGFNVDYQSLDWGTVVQRRASREPIDKGGWNIFFTTGGGTGNVSPASLTVIRANPATAWFGWPDNPRLEKARLAWYEAPDLAAQKALCGEMQAALFESPTYAPLGLFYQPTTFRSDLKDVPEGIPQFYRVRRSA
ncbi:MAG: ABC transporter substrate-binding protein [Acetobacteraceae bacterium]